MSFRNIAMVALIFFITWRATIGQAPQDDAPPISAAGLGELGSKKGTMDNHASMHATRKSPAPPTRIRAEAKITVQASEAKAYDETVSPALVEIRLRETFTGDMNGESTVRALEIKRNDQSSNLVSMQRFSGKLGGRQGTFVLQGSETVEDGRIRANWFVVPGSGTGSLSGLRGKGGFEGRFGKASVGTLDYWFE